MCQVFQFSLISVVLETFFISVYSNSLVFLAGYIEAFCLSLPLSRVARPNGSLGPEIVLGADRVQGVNSRHDT